jgi:osmoprotectant transport system ATP-binding protein
LEERVMHLMRRGALTCDEDCSVREVAQIMAVNRIRYCVVVNKEHEVAGIISARSILKAFGKDLDKTRAKDILLPYTITITPNSPLKSALDIMTRKKIEHLVVVSDRPGSKAVFGILHAADIVIKMAHA